MYKKSLIKTVTIVILLLIIIYGTSSLLDKTSSNIDLDEKNVIADNKVVHSGTPRSVPRTSTDWPMFRHDLAHTGLGSSSVPDNNTILWTNTTGNGNGYGSPVIADNKVFISSNDGYLYCYDLNTGDEIWKTFLSSSGYSLCSTPGVANNHVVIFCDGDDAVYSLWVSNGTVDWSYDTGSGPYGGSSPAITNGKIYIGSSNRYLYCLNETTGSLIWSYRTGAGPVRNYGIQSSPAVANGRVFVGACDCYLYCFNESQPSAPSANYYWRTFLSDAVFASPAVANGRVYCGSGYYNYGEGSHSHTMFCLNELTGAVIWSYLTGSDILCSPAIAENKLYFTSTDGNLYCVDAMSAGPTPTLHWSNTTGDTWSSPAVADGKVVVGSKTDWVSCYNSTTGALNWSYNVGNDVYGSPAIANGKVVVYRRGSPEMVYCFGEADPIPPTVVSTYPADNAVDVPVTSYITAKFSKAMMASTITTSAFILKDSAQNPVGGAVDYNATTYTATFNPDGELNRSETYEATILSIIKDESGLELDGNDNGILEGSPVDDYTWNFTTSLNNPPKLTNMSIIPTTGELTTEFEYSVVYTDLDNDTPILNPGYIRIHIDNELVGRAMSLNTSALLHLRDGDFSNGEQYIYKTILSTYGLHKYKFNCSDGFDINETQVFDNPLILAKPVIDPIDYQTAYEDIDLILNLSGKIHDDDTNLSDLIITENSSYATINDFNITLNYPNEFNYPSSRTYEIVAINVSDSVHEVSRNIKINVIPVNDPPQISGLSNFPLNEDQEYILDVLPYINDEDNELDELTIFTNSSHAAVDGKNITFYYPVDSGILYEYINIQVYDGELYGYQNITVTVIPEGVAFVLLPIPNQNAVEDIDLVIDMANYIQSVEHSIDEFEININSSYGDLNTSGDNRLLIFNYPNSFNYPSVQTYEFVKVNVSLDEENQDSKSFKITVQPVNDPPQISGLSNFPLNEGQEYILNVSPHISDIDNELDDLTIATNSSYATVNGKNITFYYPMDSGILHEYVKIQVYDGELYSHQNITVAVIPEGVAFVLLPIPNQNAVEDIDLVIDMANYIQSVEHSIDEFEININSSYGDLNTSGGNSLLIFNYPNSFNYPSGRTYEFVQVNVSLDEENQDSKSFKITVQPVNDPPYLINEDVNPDTGNISINFTFSVNYFDIDGSDSPSLNVVIDNNSHIMAYVSGNKNLESEGAIYQYSTKLSEGVHTYYFNCDDSSGKSNSYNSTIAYTIVVVGIEIPEEQNDTDGDGMPDWWETLYGLDPNDSSDADKDWDGDGYTNLEEYLSGTDPLNPLDFPDLNLLPIANAGGNQTVNVGELVFFNGSASFDPDGKILNCTWDFNDGNLGYGIITSHVYNKKGTYSVTLTVTDNRGDTNWDSVIIIVEEKEEIKIDEDIDQESNIVIIVVIAIIIILVLLISIIMWKKHSRYVREEEEEEE